MGVLNGIVTTVLNPFLAPAPDSPEPFTPIMWAALAWVRRNAFNQAPVVSSPTTTVQTGQTVTGNIGVTDAEGDELTYTVTEAPKYGTVTINQETGEFTYTPDDIDYDAAQVDSFTVSVTDGDKVNLLALFKPRTAQNDIDVTVLSPTVERVILTCRTASPTRTLRASPTTENPLFLRHTNGRRSRGDLSDQCRRLDCRMHHLRRVHGHHCRAGQSRSVRRRDGAADDPSQDQPELLCRVRRDRRRQTTGSGHHATFRCTCHRSAT